MRGPEVSPPLSRAGSRSITGAVGHISDILNQARQQIEIGGCARAPVAVLSSLIDLSPAPLSAGYLPTCEGVALLAAASTFQFVLNVGAEVAAFDSQQALLRSGLRKVGDSRHAGP